MENLIKVQLPVFISYPALQGVLKKQMVGEYIPKPEKDTQEPPYARILAIEIAGSTTGSRELILKIKISILRTVLKRDEVDLRVAATIAYDNAKEELFIEKFRLESRTRSPFYNTALEVLANKVAYGQILKRTRFKLGDLIGREVSKANKLLESGLEIKGIKLKGQAEGVRVQNLLTKEGGMHLLLELQANLEAEIFDLTSLLPPK